MPRQKILKFIVVYEIFPINDCDKNMQQTTVRHNIIDILQFKVLDNVVICTYTDVRYTTSLSHVLLL